MHITKILVNSGQVKIVSKDSRRPALDETIGVWVEDLLRTNRQKTLPGPWSGYSATAADFQGGLVLSVYLEESATLAQTVAIARHAAHGRPLWRVISALSPRSGCETPPCKTWCAVLEHGEMSLEKELEDFALACAWFWRTHGSKFSRRARGNRRMDGAIFRPAGSAANDRVTLSGADMDTRLLAGTAVMADDCQIFLQPDPNGEEESLVVEVPHVGGNIMMTVPRSLLELCFSINASDPSIDCVSKNMPLFVAAAYSEYQQASARSFELTEFHIAGAQKDMAMLEKRPARPAPRA